MGGYFELNIGDPYTKHNQPVCNICHDYMLHDRTVSNIYTKMHWITKLPRKLVALQSLCDRLVFG
jgi:hypothetical protein